MNSTLREVIADFMTHYGSIIGDMEEDAVEYLGPKNFTDALGIPEFGRLAFSHHPAVEPAIDAAYDSDFMRQVHTFLSQKGRMAWVAYPSGPVNIEKFSNQIFKIISFSNATFRLGSHETRDVLYDLIFFKYTAVADDRQEGLIAVLRNGLNGCISIVSREALPTMLEQMQESSGPSHDAWPDVEKSMRLSHAAAVTTVKRKTEDFAKSLEKRLNRDIQRISGYYAQLTQETERLGARLQTQADAKKDQIERLRGKCDAIAAEKKWKIQDMISKYALTATVDPIIFMRINVASTVFWMDIHRRKQTRRFGLTYNPLSKQLDFLPCESCFALQGERCICDTHFHIICPACFPVCAVCAKKYCRACHPHGCPRCQVASGVLQMKSNL